MSNDLQSKQMTTVELTVRLPEDVAEEAQAAGLLSSDGIASLITEAVRQQRVRNLFDAADRLADLDAPPLSQAEIAAEIEAARQQKALSRAGR